MIAKKGSERLGPSGLSPAVMTIALEVGLCSVSWQLTASLASLAALVLLDSHIDLERRTLTSAGDAVIHNISDSCGVVSTSGLFLCEDVFWLLCQRCRRSGRIGLQGH